jgi:acetyl esterase/lipase
LLPAGWVKEATAGQVPNGDNPASDWNQGYGFQFWRCRHGIYRGDGKDGQFCIVLPDRDAVIAITAHTHDLQGVLHTVWDHLLPAFHADPLPENPDAQATLAQTLAGRKVRTMRADGAAARAEAAGGVGRVIPLWPGEAPGESEEIGPEHDTTTGSGNRVAGQRVMRVGNVSQPTLSLFRPPADQDTGAAVVVCPGGGYNILAYDLEGTEVCDWLNSMGITGALLKYRVPARPGPHRHAAPAQDAQRALGLVRHHAAEWGIDPDRIGVLGFSAGGHLSAWLSNHQGARTYPRVDAADDVSCRPDFAVLVYPAYLTQKAEGDRIAPDLTISPQTPPTFLVMSQDDPIRVENVLRYAGALQDVHVPFELHVYPRGGHGYGLRPRGAAVTTWPARAADWMRGLGVCGAAKADPAPKELR